MYQQDELRKIINIIMDRVLTDDDKQYKSDVEDIIEDQLSQCVQFFYKDAMMEKHGIDEN